MESDRWSRAHCVQAHRLGQVAWEALMFKKTSTSAPSPTDHTLQSDAICSVSRGDRFVLDWGKGSAVILSWSQYPWLCILAFLLQRCVVLSSSLHLSEPQYPICKLQSMIRIHNNNRKAHGACYWAGTLWMVVIIIFNIIVNIVITHLDPCLLLFFLLMLTADWHPDFSPWCFLGLNFCFPADLSLEFDSYSAEGNIQFFDSGTLQLLPQLHFIPYPFVIVSPILFTSRGVGLCLFWSASYLEAGV